MSKIGRLLLTIGLIIAAVGLLLLLAGRFFPWLGRLPGDLRYESEHVRIYFPLATMILISLIGTLVLNILLRIFRR